MVEFMKSAAPELKNLTRALDYNLMTRDTDKIQEIRNNPGLFETTLVTWDLEDMAGSVRILPTVWFRGQEESYVVRLEPLLTSQEECVETLIQLFIDYTDSQHVCNLMKGNQTYVSSFPTKAFGHPMPVLASFAKHGTRFTANMISHPQLGPNRSMIRSFPMGTKFVTNGQYMAASLLENRNISTEFFEVLQNVPFAPDMALEKVEIEGLEPFVAFALGAIKQQSDLI